QKKYAKPMYIRLPWMNLRDSNSGAINGMSNSAIDGAKITQELTKLKTEKEMLQYVKEQSKGKTYREKLSILASIVGNFSAGYDNDRTNLNHKNSKGAVSLKQMIDAIKISMDSGNKIDAGVCRDMHIAIAKLGRAMGMKHIYGVSYNTHNSGHLTTVATQSNNYGSVDSLNYSKHHEKKGVIGPRALELNEGIPSHGLDLTISDPTGKSRIKLPSGLLMSLMEASNGQLAHLHAGLREENQTGEQNKTGVKTPYGNIRYFKSESSMGTPAMTEGIGLDTKLELNDYLTGELGYTIYNNERESREGPIKSAGQFLRAEAELEHGYDLEVGQVKLGVDATYRHSLITLKECRSNPGNECYDNVSSFNTGNLGVRFHQQFGDSFKLTEGMTFNFQVLKDDIKSAESNSSIETPVTRFFLRGEADFGKNLNLELGGSLIRTDVGDIVYSTYTVDSLIRSPSVGAQLEVINQGRLSGAGEKDVVPVWVPGSSDQTTIRLTQKIPSTGGSFGGEGKINHDFSDLSTFFVIFSIGDNK
ncbi:MAG: hypothetical protein HOJ35_04090, partial [Bdellovibrionales bacterium]|nr:hypothetical protein [Bdellovibrionales bacterium]